MWTYERIAQLCTDEVQSLCKNGRNRSAEECANVKNRQRRQSNAPSGLLDLAIVSQRNADEVWVRSEIETAGFRFTDTKTKIVCSAYALFAALGEPSKLLKELSSSDSRAQAHSPMALFYDLAKNKLSDKDIHLSEKFSADIDHKPFYGLGPKQIRNILVNSGLAFNVVPLDSRWKKFLEDRAGIIINGKRLGQLNYYLQVEEVLRKALRMASAQRADIPDLATLDAIVFSTFD